MACQGTLACPGIHPDKLYDYVAIKRPSRDKNVAPELTEEESSEAIQKFKRMLNNGIELKHVSKTLDYFMNAKLFLVESSDGLERYYIQSDKINGYWENISNISIKCPVYKNNGIKHIFYQALTTTHDGILEHADIYLIKYINTFPTEVVQRLLLYFSYGPEIEIYHIGRDGTGTDYNVDINDTAVNYILSLICILYGRGLIKSGNKYIVKNGPIFWNVIKLIKDKYMVQKNNGYYTWVTPKPETRSLWDHQIDSINTLYGNNKRVDVIWIPPGLGKTAIVSNYTKLR